MHAPTVFRRVVGSPDRAFSSGENDHSASDS